MATATCKTVAGPQLATGNVAWGGSSARRKNVNWLPPASTPVLDAKGRFTRPWYLFFQEISEKRLGGIEAITVPDIVTVQSDTQAQVLTVQSNTSAAIQTVNACVTAVNTTKQVAVNNSLSGATQIPTVQPANPKLAIAE